MLALCPYIYENCLFVHSHFDRFTSPMRNSFYEYYTYTYIISNKIRKTVEHRERQTERDRDTDRQRVLGFNVPSTAHGHLGAK